MPPEAVFVSNLIGEVTGFCARQQRTTGASPEKTNFSLGSYSWFTLPLVRSSTSIGTRQMGSGNGIMQSSLKTVTLCPSITLMNKLTRSCAGWSKRPTKS